MGTKGGSGFGLTLYAQEKRRPATWHHLVRRLTAITSRQQQTQGTLLDWLRVEFGIE